MKQKLALVLTFILLTLSAFGEGKTVKIAYLPLTHAYPLFVENEIYEKGLNGVNIELVKFGSWVELAEALNTGKVDGASILIELAMKAKENGIGLKAVALGHRDGNVFVVSPEINKVSDLKGKTIAIPSKLSTHNILLNQILKSAKLSIADIKVIELPPPEMPAALAEKRINAYIVAEPFGAKAVAIGKGKVLFKSEQIWDNSICCALVLRDEFINGKREIAQEVVNGYLKGAALAEKRDEAALNVGKKYLKADDNVLKLSLQWISYKDLKIGEGDYAKLRNYLIELGLSKNPPLYKDFVDNTFINKVK